MDRRICLIAATLATGGILASAIATAATPAPRLTAVSVLGDQLNLTFSVAVSRGEITVLVNGRIVDPRRRLRNGRRITLVLPRALYSDDVAQVTVSGARTSTGQRVPVTRRVARNQSTTGCGELVTGGFGSGIYLRPTGSIRLLTVRVDFPDRIERSREITNPDALPSWLAELSYGRLKLSTYTHPEIVTLPRNRLTYEYNVWPEARPLYQEVVQAIDGGVDFGQYDALILRGTVLGGRGFTALPGSGIVADGKELRFFGSIDAFRETALLPLFVQFFGLQRISPLDVGVWDPLGGSASFGMFAWNRRRIDWLDATQVRCLRHGSLETTLSPTFASGGMKLALLPTGPDSAIAVENRQRQGLDAGQCGHGLLVYEITVSTLRVLPRPGAAAAPGCGVLSAAPYDLAAGERVAFGPGGVFALDVLESLGDGSYRLRVSR